MLLLPYACKNEKKDNHEYNQEVLKMTETIKLATDLKQRLILRSDSIKVTNEFEAIKIENILNMMDQNVMALQNFKDSLTHGRDHKIYDKIIHTALTQDEYVNTLILSAEALLENRSLSFGTWKNGMPKAINDTILTPVKK